MPPLEREGQEKPQEGGEQCLGCGVYAVPEGYPGRNDQQTVKYVDLPLRGGGHSWERN